MDGGKKNKRNTDSVEEQKQDLLNEEVDEEKRRISLQDFDLKRSVDKQKLLSTALDDSPRQRLCFNKEEEGT